MRSSSSFSRIRLCALLLGFALEHALTHAEVVAPPEAESWGLADQEIPRSPRVTWGRLDSGFNFAILPHAIPPGRVSLRLLVRVGSLHEEDNESGYAHFVEHMAFNGTEHFPPGELVRLLQRQGAQFGPHVNATTTQTRTLYQLDLPSNSAENVGTAMRILRDFADGIKFDDEEVKRERGVILSEERSRRTPQEAERIAFTRLVFDGTRIPQREPIGTSSSIEGALSPALRHFYDAWYRPERMTLVIVGDIDRAQTEAVLRKSFKSLVARAPARTEPNLGVPTQLSEPIVVVHGNQGVGVRMSLTGLSPRPQYSNTYGTELAGLRWVTAWSMLRNRLGHLEQVPASGISDSHVELKREFLHFRRFTLGVNTSIENWRKALETVEHELRRALEFGFAQSELAWQQDQLRREVRINVEGAATLTAPMIADAIAEDAEDTESSFAFANEVHRTEIIEQLTTEGCRQALRDVVGQQPLRIFFTGNQASLPTATDIKAAFENSQTVILASAKPIERLTFAYEDFGPAGSVSEKRFVGDLDFWLVRFSNGVRLNVKSTQFEKGLARVRIRFGSGRLLEPVHQPGLGLWVFAWWFGGSGKHSYSDYSRMSEGLSAMVLSPLDDAFEMTAVLRSDEMPMVLRQITAVFADPAFRTEAWPYAESVLRGLTSPLWNQPEGPVQQLILPLLAGGDLRLGIPGDHVLYSRTRDELRSWLGSQVASGPMELAVIGDVDVDDVIAEISKTFGALPVRESYRLNQERTKLNFPLQPVSTYAYYEGTEDRPSALEFFWPVRDQIANTQRRHLHLLADILENRITEQFREQNSITFSPRASLMWNSTYPGFSFIRCTVEVAPSNATDTGDAIRELAAQMSRGGVKPDELLRAKAQRHANARAARTDNEAWLVNVLSDVQQRPHRLDEARTLETDIDSATVGDVNALARRYLGTDKPFRYIIDPNSRIQKQ